MGFGESVFRESEGHRQWTTYETTHCGCYGHVTDDVT